MVSESEIVADFVEVATKWMDAFEEHVQPAVEETIDTLLAAYEQVLEDMRRATCAFVFSMACDPTFAKYMQAQWGDPVAVIRNPGYVPHDLLPVVIRSVRAGMREAATHDERVAADRKLLLLTLAHGGVEPWRSGAIRALEDEFEIKVLK